MIYYFKKEYAPEIDKHISNRYGESVDESEQPAVEVEEDLGEEFGDPKIIQLMMTYNLDDDQAAMVRDMMYRWGIDEHDAVERVKRVAG